MTKLNTLILAAIIGFSALPALADTGDLYDAGLTSFASVQLMLAIEDAFGIEFPETMLNRRSFSSIANIARCVEDLTQAKVS